MDLREINQISFQDEINHWWIKSRLALLRNAIRKIGKRDLSVREYGFGTGQNIWLMQTLPEVKSIEGVDPFWSEEIPVSFELTRGKLSKTDSNTSVDLIVAMDVLEHIENDKEVLQFWRERLNPDGYLFATVPAFQILWSSHDEFLGHKRRYTRTQFDSLMESVGFKPVYSSYLFSPFFILVYLIRKLKKSDGKNSDLAPINPILNTLFYLITRLEILFGGCPLFGTSVFGLYRRSK